MQAVAGQPFTSTLIDPAGLANPLGARVEVPVTRAIVSAYQLATLDGATWSVELDAPLTAGEYLLVWRTNDAEPPEYETFVPLSVSASGAVVGLSEDNFPLVDESLVRPDVDDIALLADTYTASGGGGEAHEFTSETDPTADQVDGLIDRAVEAVLAQLPTRFNVAHYERVRHAVELYTLVILPGSFREQGGSDKVDTWRALLAQTMNGLTTRIEEERREARKLGRLEPRPLSEQILG